MNADYWYSSLAAMDAFLLGLWLFAALITPMLFWGRKVLNIQLKPISFNLPHFWPILVIAALALRLPRLLFEPFWYDETFTAAMANTSLENFLPALSGDVHPPLFYAMAWIISHVSSAEWAFRLPSLIAGMALIYVAYKLALELFHDETIGKIAALLIAFMPAMIHYSSEARYPMALALSVSIAWLALLKKQPFIVCFAAICAALLHATGLIYALALIGLMVKEAIFSLKHKEGKAIKWASYSTVLLLFCGAIAALMQSQSKDLVNGFWLWQMIPLWHITDDTISRQLVGGDYSFIVFVSYVLIALFSILSSVLMLRSNKDSRFYFLAIGLAVPALVFVIGFVFRPVYLPRALIASVIPLLIGMAALARRNQIIAALLCMVTFSSMALYLMQENKNDLRALFSHCEGSDFTYTTSTNMSIVSLYYAPSHSLSFADGNNQHQELSLASRQALNFDFMPPEIIGGDVCLVVAWNYYTTETERQRVESLRRYEVRSEIIEDNVFWTYEVIWLNTSR